MGPTWVLLAPDGPHVGPMNLVIGDDLTGYYVLTIYVLLLQAVPLLLYASCKQNMETP